MKRRLLIAAAVLGLAIGISACQLPTGRTSTAHCWVVVNQTTVYGGSCAQAYIVAKEDQGTVHGDVPPRPLGGGT